MLPPSSLLLAGLAAHASATTIPVLVGKSGLTFTPSEISAKVGDVVEFRFYPKNHSVVAGDFSSACTPASSNGFFSGFFPTTSGANSQVFRVNITSTTPLPIYCSQNTGQHCKNGMVAVINGNSATGQDFNAYKSAAAALSGSGNAVSPPGGVSGGVVAPNTAIATSTVTTTTTSETGSAGVTSSSGEGQTTSTGTATQTTGTGAAGTSTSASATASHTNAAAGLAAAPVAGLAAVAFGVLFV